MSLVLSLLRSTHEALHEKNVLGALMLVSIYGLGVYLNSLTLLELEASKPILLKSKVHNYEKN